MGSVYFISGHPLGTGGRETVKARTSCESKSGRGHFKSPSKYLIKENNQKKDFIIFFARQEKVVIHYKRHVTSVFFAI